jgi:outer membrane protein assembly factor BamB
LTKERAYDVKTGDLVWTANTDTEGLECAYEMTPLTLQTVNGKVYARSTVLILQLEITYGFSTDTGVHSPSQAELV